MKTSSGRSLHTDSATRSRSANTVDHDAGASAVGEAHADANTAMHTSRRAITSMSLSRAHDGPASAAVALVDPADPTRPSRIAVQARACTAAGGRQQIGCYPQ